MFPENYYYNCFYLGMAAPYGIRTAAKYTKKWLNSKECPVPGFNLYMPD
jgi:hypothetical protein